MYYPSVKKKILPRPQNKKKSQLKDIDPLLIKIFSTRDITSNEQIERSLNQLPSPWLLTGMKSMVEHLITAIKQQQKICIVADFDADGATSCAVATRGLQQLGAKHVSYVVPNRFEYGYGLTPEIVELVKQQQANVILTVDNGISSIEGVISAQEAGIKVLVTDHHLPGKQLPPAEAIVNPNLLDDEFPSKNIAGVGVVFYVLMALRMRLRENHWFEQHNIQQPNLGQLLDYVALGTVADVVALDHVNRILVHQGLLRIRSGQSHFGIKALINIAGRKSNTLQSSDLGFSLAPRLNAAGRMDDMSLGIQCLLSDSATFAKQMAERLEQLNQERKEVESKMKGEALSFLNEMALQDKKYLSSGVCLFEKSWHQGVIGILASRIKDRLHRPVIAFALTGKDEIKGSARSITGVHIRDILSEIATTHPQLLSNFGGHAMAAGMTLKMHDYPAFTLIFNDIVEKRLNHIDLEQKIYSDGQLSEKEITLEFTEMLNNAGTWGQAFPEPIFDGIFDVIQCRIVGQQHLKFVLRLPSADQLIDAIAFFVDKPESWLGIRSIHAAYQLSINEFRGNRSVQLMLQYIEKIT